MGRFPLNNKIMWCLRHWASTACGEKGVCLLHKLLWNYFLCASMHLQAYFCILTVCRAAKYKRLCIKMSEIMLFELTKPYNNSLENKVQITCKNFAVKEEAVWAAGLWQSILCSSRREENLWPIQSETFGGKEACEDGFWPSSIKFWGTAEERPPAPVAKSVSNAGTTVWF